MTEKLPSGIEVLSVTWMPSVRRYCLSLTGRPEDAEDVLQETFLEAQKNFGRFKPDGDFGAWLRGIARNVAARRRSRRVQLSLEPKVLERLEALVRQEEEVDVSPIDVLRGCLGKLTEDDRELLRSRYERGTALEAVVKALGKSLSWAKSRLLRLRLALADCVTREMKRLARTTEGA